MRHPALNRAIFVFSLLGAVIAGYLWYMHGHAADIPCGSSGGCETVASSRYSRFPFGSGPPVAAWGTVGYVALATLAFLRTLADDPRRDRTLLSLIGAGAAVGSAGSLYLTYLEIYVIKAICRWCVGSQIVILIVGALALADFLRVRAATRPEGVAHR